MPDGSSAYEISGNTVTIRLIEDISAKSGMALVQPILYDSDGNTLGIWYTEIVVRRGVSKESSSTGVNYSSYENDIGTLQAKVKRLESLVDGGSTPETYGITQSCTNCTSSSNISAVNKMIRSLQHIRQIPDILLLVLLLRWAERTLQQAL